MLPGVSRQRWQLYCHPMIETVVYTTPGGARPRQMTADTGSGAPHAMTVEGPIAVEELGPTHIHEHLYVDARPILSAHPYVAVSEEPLTLEMAAEARWNPGGFPDNYHQTDVELVVAELVPFREAGGRTIVEVIPSHLSRNPSALREIARRANVHVVMGGGYYLGATHPPGTAERAAEEIAAELIAEWQEGVEGTGIRPGIIGEIGTSVPLLEQEEKVLRAVSWAHLETGLPVSIHVHPWGSEGIKVLSALEAEGVPSHRVILGHMNTAIHDLRYQLEMLERGVNLGYDLMGFDHSLIGLGRYPPSDVDVVARIVSFADDGHLDQLFISQDMGGVKTRLLAYGGWGYAHILRHIVPLFRDRAWGDEEIATLLERNPARLLTITGLKGE